MHNIVEIVVNPKINVVIATFIILPLAAGYITRGISGSHGPNINIIKRTHGVKLSDFEL